MYTMKLQNYQPENRISGDSKEETILLREMAIAARNYISSFQWCPPIKEIFLAYGIGNVAAVFLVHFAKPINGNDEYLWVITGDLPTAYLVLDQSETPSQALQMYCQLMEDWANMVLEGKDLSKVFTVNVEASSENAHSLKKRVKFLRERIIPLSDQQRAGGEL